MFTLNITSSFVSIAVHSECEKIKTSILFFSGEHFRWIFISHIAPCIALLLFLFSKITKFASSLLLHSFSWKVKWHSWSSSFYIVCNSDIKEITQLRITWKTWRPISIGLWGPSCHCIFGQWQLRPISSPSHTKNFLSDLINISVRHNTSKIITIRVSFYYPALPVFNGKHHSLSVHGYHSPICLIFLKSSSLYKPTKLSAFMVKIIQYYNGIFCWYIFHFCLWRCDLVRT